MPGPGAAGRLLLEREILPAPFEKERADRRFPIGPVKDDAAGDPHGRFERHRIGRRPAGGGHGAHEIGFGAFEADIDDVAGDALGGDGAGAEIRNLSLPLVVAPHERRGQIGQREIGRRDRRDDGKSAASIEFRRRHLG